MLSTSVPGRVLVELSALTFSHMQTGSDTSYLTGVLQTIVHVCEILGVAKTKTSGSTRLWQGHQNCLASGSLRRRLRKIFFFFKGYDGKSNPLGYGRGEVVTWKRGNVAWFLSHGHEPACARRTLSGTMDALEGGGGRAIGTISHSMYSQKDAVKEG